MKKKVIILSLLILSSLGACNQSQVTSSQESLASLESINSSNSEISSDLSSDESSNESILSMVSSDDSSNTSSDSSSSSNTNQPFLTAEEAQMLVINAGSVDVGYAKTADVTLTASGYDGGIRYDQTMYSQYTTYKDDITIGSGSVHHVVHGADGDVTYNDNFDEVNLIRNYYLIQAIVYENSVFESNTDRTNLFEGSDVGSISDNFQYAQELVSCGAGSKAFDDLYYATVLESTFYYSASQQNGKVALKFYAEAENNDSNQKYIATFTYEFDSKEHGFLQKYVSEQAFYRLDDYESTDDLSTLVPLDYSLETNRITSGELDEFTDEFPIDIDSSFVQSITLSAAETTLEVGETLAIRAVVEPETAVNKSLIFSSTNENVAVVTNDSTGTILALGEGTCEIVALNVESGVEGRISITVTKKAKPDTGDDVAKADLKEALDESLYQILTLVNYCSGAGEFSGTGVLIEKTGSLNSISLSTLSLSDFVYNPKTRVASYVGDDIQDRMSRILPLIDNGNENLSNYYGFVNDKYVYYQSIEEFEIHLATDNTIDYIDVVVRNNAFEPTISAEKFATLTDENIVDELGECPINKWGTVHIYVESQGFVYPDE